MTVSSRHTRGGPDRWLLSYADFMTLLFAFFTTMYAISTVDAESHAPNDGPPAVASGSSETAVAPSFGRTQAVVAPGFSRTQTGVAAGFSRTETSVAPDSTPTDAATDASLAEIEARLSHDLIDALAGGQIEMVREARGLVLSLPESATFPVGSAEIAREARETIERIGAALAPFEHPVRVEGHTDNVPIHTSRYRSNWELSTARASAVVELFVRMAALAPERLSAAGYGEFHPRASNDSPEGRMRNRRVDLVILGRAERAVEPPVAGGAP